MRIEDIAMTGRITVYGSCVARDAASEMENRGWSVERYIARQSLISAGRPADVGDLDLSLLASSLLHVGRGGKPGGPADGCGRAHGSPAVGPD